MKKLQHTYFNLEQFKHDYTTYNTLHVMIFANLFTFSSLIYLVSSNLEAIAPIIRAAPILGLLI